MARDAEFFRSEARNTLCKEIGDLEKNREGSSDESENRRRH